MLPITGVVTRHILCNHTMLIMETSNPKISLLSPDNRSGDCAPAVSNIPTITGTLSLMLSKVISSETLKASSQNSYLLGSVFIEYSKSKLWSEHLKTTQALCMSTHPWGTWSCKCSVADSGTGPDGNLSAYGQLLATRGSENLEIDPNLGFCFCSLRRKI